MIITDLFFDGGGLTWKTARWTGCLRYFAVYIMWDGMCGDKTSPEGYRRIKERLFQMSMANLMFVVGVVGGSFVVLEVTFLKNQVV